MAFLLAFLIPSLVIASVWLASVSPYPNLVICLPLFIAYFVFPLAQALWLASPIAPQLVNISERQASRPIWRRYYRVLPLLAVPAHFLMLCTALVGFASISFNAIGKCVLIITTGVFAAMFAINVAHELMHRRSRVDRFCAGLLLSSVCFGTFKTVHMHIHHPFVCTPRDFATARRNQSIYSFWLQSFIGNFYHALTCERARLGRNGKSIWQSDLLVWFGFSGLWLSLAILWGGLAGGVFFILQSIIAIMYLDVINYLQHYGLQRRVNSEGMPNEPMQEHHSWTQGMLLDDLVLFNLPRHALHHTQPQRPFQLLRDSHKAPRYPFNYGLMTLLVFVPPLFKKIAGQCLDNFDCNHHQDITVND